MTNDKPSTDNTSTNDSTNDSTDDASPDTSTEFTSMDLRQLHSSQQEAMKKINEFSGEPNESDIDEWLYDLTNLFTVMKLKDETRILLTMGKLIGPALRWYQANLTSFDNWKNAEDALRSRFKTFTSDSQLMQEFFKLQQEEHQSITSFYEDVIRKYKRSKGLITEQQVITVLQTGVKQTLKEHLIRNEQNITKPEEWLDVAREEEHIQQRIQQQRHASPTEKINTPYFEPTLPTATIQFQSSKNASQNSRTHNPRHHHYQNRTHVGGNNQSHYRPNKVSNTTLQRSTNEKLELQKSEPCLICNRTNHPTMKCFYKKKTGCFKCGQPSHRIRNCPQHHFFE
jgi:hypothetical protein